MAEKNPHVKSNRIRQLPWVPFLWEEQPGIAKKEWKLDSSTDTVSPPFSPQQPIHHSSYVNLMDSPLPLPPALISVHELRSRSQDGARQENPYPKIDIKEESNNTTVVARVPSRPFKLVGSVPFTWEAKPGTPLSSFSWMDMPETDENNHQQEQIPNLDICLEPVKTSAVMLPVKFVASVPFSWEEKPGKPLPSWEEDCFGNNSSQLFEFDVESFSFDTNESLSSESSLMANCLLPSASISNAVPVQTNPFLSMDEDENNYPQPDTCSDTDSSYDTEAENFVGSSLLEWLFPNFPPKVGILENNESCKRVPEKVNPKRMPAEQLEAGPTDFGSSINGSFAIRKPKTLGELIMMSRRRSYVRKAAQVRKQNPSMHEFVKRSTFGCWTFGQGLNLKRQLRLKIV